MENNHDFDSRLNNRFLHELYEGDTEHAASMFDQFLLLVPGLMHEIEEGFKSDNLESFRQKVHKVKPVFSMVGLTDLTDQAEMIEKKCKHINELQQIEEEYKNFRDRYNVSLPIIENELNRLENKIS